MHVGDMTKDELDEAVAEHCGVEPDNYSGDVEAALRLAEYMEQERDYYVVVGWLPKEDYVKCYRSPDHGGRGDMTYITWEELPELPAVICRAVLRAMQKEDEAPGRPERQVWRGGGR